MASQHVAAVPAVDYPSDDGQPMAESDFQRDPLMYAVQALDRYFRDRVDVYVSGNLLIYDEPGNRLACVAPDVFVVFGVPKRKRSSYLLWEEGKAPSFVLEITSRSTRKKDQVDNPRRYAAWGVPEYFQYDPTGDYLRPPLQGQRLEHGAYQPLPTRREADGTYVVSSAVLELELRLQGNDLRFYQPATGQRLLSHEEAETARLEAETAQREAEIARREAEIARREAEMARREAETRWHAAEAERQALLARVAALEAQLREPPGHGH